MSPLAARLRRSSFRVAVLLTLLFAASSVAIAPASAHTDLVGATPAAGSRTTEPPPRVELVFGEDVTPDLAAVVLSVDGRQLGRVPVTSGRSAGVLSADTSDVALPDPARAASWQVRYRVTSADGHPIEGLLEFTVAGRSEASAPTAGAASAPADTAADTAADAAGDTGAEAPVRTPESAPVVQESDTSVPVAAGLVLVVLALPLLLVAAVRRLRSHRDPVTGPVS